MLRFALLLIRIFRLIASWHIGLLLLPSTGLQSADHATRFARLSGNIRPPEFSIPKCRWSHRRTRRCPAHRILDDPQNIAIVIRRKRLMTRPEIRHLSRATPPRPAASKHFTSPA